MMTMPLLSVFLAAATVVPDRATHSVTFTAHPTDIEKGTTVEFAFVGPDSDRAYEALFVTDANIAEIARAFDTAGIPRGRAYDPSACRFWPVGKDVTIEPSIWDFIDDKEKAYARTFCFTGGARDKNDAPLANTNMPSALFSLYSLDQSLLLFGQTTDQSAVYGRFTGKGTAQRGKSYTFKVSWDGKSGTIPYTFRVEPGRLREAFAALKEEKGKGDLDVMPDFSPMLNVLEAKAAASALSVLDSERIRVNGFPEGQVYYRGFLPDEKWRNRQNRLTQPVEIRLTSTNTICTVIDEDWSVEGTDPKLTPREIPESTIAKTFKGDTCLVYVDTRETLSRIYALKQRLPNSIRNWYVFID